MTLSTSGFKELLIMSISAYLYKEGVCINTFFVNKLNSNDNPKMQISLNSNDNIEFFVRAIKYLLLSSISY